MVQLLKKKFIAINRTDQRIYEQISYDVYKLKIFTILSVIVFVTALIFSFPILEKGSDVYFIVKFFDRESTSCFLGEFPALLYYSTFLGVMYSNLAIMLIFVYLTRLGVYQCILLNEFIKQLSAMHRNTMVYGGKEYQIRIENKLIFCIKMSSNIKE